MFETTGKLLEDDAVGKLMYLECDYWHWIGPHYHNMTGPKQKGPGATVFYRPDAMQSMH